MGEEDERVKDGGREKGRKRVNDERGAGFLFTTDENRAIHFFFFSQASKMSYYKPFLFFFSSGPMNNVEP